MISNLLPAQKKSDSVIPGVGFCIVPIPFPHGCFLDELWVLSLFPYCIKPPNCNHSVFILFDLTGVKPFSLECRKVPYDLSETSPVPPISLLFYNLLST